MSVQTNELPLRVMTPVGYSLLKESDNHNTVYSFERDGKRHELWYSWKLGAIDAMWVDVRNRATNAARPDMQGRLREERETMTYALGYADGKFHVMEAIQRRLKLSGYDLGDTDPVSVIEHLLGLLNGK